MPYCDVVFQNQTPADWDVRIIEIGAHFFYQDANGKPTRDWQTTRSANLDSGQQDTLSSDDPNGCVAGVYAGITAYVPQQGNQVFTNASTTDPKHCLVNVPFVLAPTGSIATTGELSTALRGRPLKLLTESEYRSALESLKNTKNSKENKKT
jgi:hypothetical protein